MEKVRTSTTRWTLTRRRGIAGLAACAALLVLPAAASAAGPTAATEPVDASLITDTYALISGLVNPGGVATTYWFEWGTTTSYGSTTPVTQAGNGAADVPVDISLDGLKPATRYHFRVVAKPADAAAPEVVGADRSFKTFPALAVKLVTKTARVSGGKALVTLKAVGPPDETAVGVLKLTAKVAGKLRSFGQLSYTIAAGTTKSVRVTLTATGRSVLSVANNKRVRVQATAKTTGVKQPLVKSLTLAG
jgi:hypothetical protein